ncbi:hypothetical protein ACS5PK_17800 [Roseateles sp. DB2]|uniref:hypothetical protein n=1 Tax=Roseateles sp. DB2 TaxID=3453717 RepID=UPI003EEEC625
MAATAADARGLLRVLIGLAALACAMASQAGGVILERADTTPSAACRQGGVEWLGAGGKACPVAVRTHGGEAGAAPGAAAPRSANAASSRSADGERRQILQQELNQERARLAALQLAGREPGAPEALQRARQDVMALERELARLAP